MFAAAISLVGLAATVYLVLREAKTIRAQSGTVAKSALGGASPSACSSSF